VNSCASAADASGGAQAQDAVRIVSAAELRNHVKFEDLVEPVAAAFRDVSAGRADSGHIVMFPVQPRERGDVYVKTGTLRGHSAYVVKVSPWFAANTQRGVAQGGFVALFDSHTGHTLAVLNEEHYLSDIRTAAAGAVAARALAPSKIRTASVLGSGVQAYWQCLALHRERPFYTLLIWPRSRDKGEALRQRLLGELPGVDIRLEFDLEQAVRRGDVLICATASREPIVRGDWLREGQHITAVGADDPSKCELDVSALRRARVFVDSVATTVANGDIYRAIQGGAYSANDLMGEIGEILDGSKPGRHSDTDITIAKLVGIGAQDLVAAELALTMLKRAAQDSPAASVKVTP
jgi:ornithine cyclodeaminase/alanine dehydrogenase-like protein (mu-crystallin family)